MISSIQFNSVAPVAETSGTSTPPPAAPAATPSSITSLSPSAHMLSRLQELASSAPSQFQAITTQAATSLRGAAASSDPGQAEAMNKLADAFDQAATTGDVSGLHASAASATSSLAHHHHHAAVEGASAATTTESSVSSTTSNAQQVLDDVSAQVDQAMGFDPPPLGPWFS